MASQWRQQQGLLALTKIPALHLTAQGMARAFVNVRGAVPCCTLTGQGAQCHLSCNSTPATAWGPSPALPQAGTAVPALYSHLEQM